MSTRSDTRDLAKAARCGEPSYVWRAGQERRLKMVLEAGGDRVGGLILENGCGVGLYVEHLASHAGRVIGLEYDFARAEDALQGSEAFPNVHILNAAGETLPFKPGTFDMILSHEVLEHVANDLMSAHEMVRALRLGGRILVFAPNRWYPFETHGIYWRGRYHFGNIPLVNYLPRQIRDRLVPHVRVYTRRDLDKLFEGLPVRYIERRIIYGAYDNIITRWPQFGEVLRTLLQWLERTPLQFFGLSHFWVVEKV